MELVQHLCDVVGSFTDIGALLGLVRRKAR